ncbi:hypothetical protein TRVA0_014S02960 [Trichomonascus vanleenenianus]|uniref:MYND-type zinc finger protein MUB1 n=1 Tax=Trichomonascus vanleenenianus TaxID=2268995 RepID=UPI003ECA5655
MDGGLERLVAILKDGCRKDCKSYKYQYSSEMMLAWKWALAFQCLVFLGTRGTEHIRCRAVDAGLIPVITTILDNYLAITEYESMLNRQMSMSLRNIQMHRRFLFQQQLNQRQDPDAQSIVSNTPTLASSTTSIASSINTTITEDVQQIENVQFPQEVAQAASAVEFATLAEPASTTATGPNDAAGNTNPGAAVFSRMVPTRAQPHPTTTVATHEGMMPQEMRRERLPLQPQQVAATTATTDATGATTTTATNNNGQRRQQQQQQRNLSATLNNSGGSDPVSPRQFYRDIVRPAEEDVIWALEILAFVSKYPYLKPTFQNSHLVPQLSVRERYSIPSVVMQSVPEPEIYNANNHPSLPGVDSELKLPHIFAPFYNPSGAGCCPFVNKNNTAAAASSDDDEEEEGSEIEDKLGRGYDNAEDSDADSEKLDYEEYDFEATSANLSPEYTNATPVNLFPLVEKFTLKMYPKDIQYWAGVVMRNSCRKDESRGGIRQCASFACGKWEEYPRQFAKCRRCKRSRYCSKPCQLQAWGYHRYWCSPCGDRSENNNASSSTTSSRQESSSSHHHHHHHHHRGRPQELQQQQGPEQQQEQDVPTPTAATPTVAEPQVSTSMASASPAL